jgi:hypothetical protein
MPYITVSNSRKIIQRLDATRLDSAGEAIYKRAIYFFSKRESANLKGIRELFKDLKHFLLYYYQPIIVVDTYKYVYPESQPAYHFDNKCDRLKSNFRNIEIPVEVREKGTGEVERFRAWFSAEKFDTDNTKDYIFKLQLAFPYVDKINPKSIDYSNSGPELKKDYSLDELQEEIDDLLDKADRYFEDNPSIRDLIQRYQKMTFLAYIDGALKNNHSGLDDAELKEFLLAYDKTFKVPVKERLIEYYRILFNPDMTFEGHLLEKMGFHPCSACMR